MTEKFQNRQVPQPFSYASHVFSCSHRLRTLINLLSYSLVPHLSVICACSLPAHSFANQEELEAEINAMKRTIRSYSRGIVHPRNARWMSYWDAASFTCLCYTAIVTPYEVCVMSPLPMELLTQHPGELVVFVLNRIIE